MHNIASINSAYLLVRRKILRLYFGLPTYESQHFPLLSQCNADAACDLHNDFPYAVITLFSATGTLARRIQRTVTCAAATRIISYGYGKHSINVHQICRMKQCETAFSGAEKHLLRRGKSAVTAQETPFRAAKHTVRRLRRDFSALPYGMSHLPERCILRHGNMTDAYPPARNTTS